MIAGLLMKVAVLLAKIILAPSGIIAAATAIDTGIQKKMHGYETKTLIILNGGTNDTMKIVQALKDSNILLKGITQNETKEEKVGFWGMLLITLGASLLGNMLTGKGILRADYGYKDFQSKEGKGILRDGYGNFNSTPFINKVSNAEVLSKWIQI